MSTSTTGSKRVIRQVRQVSQKRPYQHKHLDACAAPAA
jgi:hypothetical protein